MRVFFYFPHRPVAPVVNVVRLDYDWRWLLSSIPTVTIFDRILLKSNTKKMNKVLRASSSAGRYSSSTRVDHEKKMMNSSSRDKCEGTYRCKSGGEVGEGRTTLYVNPDRVWRPRVVRGKLSRWKKKIYAIRRESTRGEKKMNFSPNKIKATGYFCSQNGP